MPQSGDSPVPGRVAQSDQQHAEALQLLRDARVYGLVVLPKEGGLQCRSDAANGFEAKWIAVGFAGLIDSFPGMDYGELVQLWRAMDDIDEHEQEAE